MPKKVSHLTQPTFHLKRTVGGLSPSKSQLPGLERKTISAGQQDAGHPEGPGRVSVKILAEDPGTSPHKPGGSPADTCCVSRASEAAE